MLGLYLKKLVLKPNNLIKILSFKKNFHALIVKPYFGCSTKKIYSKVKKFTKSEFHSFSGKMLSVKFLKNVKNDLETIALNEFPKLKILRNFLEDLAYVEFVRMTGSGSAIIAYFTSVRKCQDAKKKVKKQFRNYWCKISKTI